MADLEEMNPVRSIIGACFRVFDAQLGRDRHRLNLRDSLPPRIPEK
jgi:hypothetical protein